MPMRYLFTPGMEKQLKEFVRPGTLLAFDFDGTLAPIVSKPGAAALGAQTAKLLGALCEEAPVAVLSGRSAADVRSKVPFRLVACVGNHGMEGIVAHRKIARDANRAVKSWEKQLGPLLEGLKGVFVEGKRYSLTVHYRAARDRKAALEKITEALESLNPPARLLAGKCVVNVLLPGSPHKGIALREILRAGPYERAFFVGDDDTDEDVFKMKDPRIFSLRVGRRPGSPAQAYLQSQSEMRKVLRFLLAAVREEHLP